MMMTPMEKRVVKTMPSAASDLIILARDMADESQAVTIPAPSAPIIIETGERD
jgi:hypothetical protein